MKKLITASWTAGSFNLDKFGRGLLLFRNTARSGGQSPAQMVFQRPVRDCLPAHRRFFAAEWQKNANTLEKRIRRAKELRTEHFNRRAHPLPPFAVGNHVLIQHPITKRWETSGVIVEVGPNRDYLVKTPAGRIFRRNRRFLRRQIPIMPAAAEPPAAAGPLAAAPPAAPAAPHPAAIPQPGPNPGRADQEEEGAPPPLRRSGRDKTPSLLYPSHTWSK